MQWFHTLKALGISNAGDRALFWFITLRQDFISRLDHRKVRNMQVHNRWNFVLCHKELLNLMPHR